MIVEGRSQPTYEELKRKPPSFLFARPAGSQPTYEELKPPAAPVYLKNIWFSAYL